MTDIEFTDDYLVLRDKSLILKLRSLGAGVEEAEETKITPPKLASPFSWPVLQPQYGSRPPAY